MIMKQLMPIIIVNTLPITTPAMKPGFIARFCVAAAVAVTLHTGDSLTTNGIVGVGITFTAVGEANCIISVAVGAGGIS